MPLLCDLRPLSLSAEVRDAVAASDTGSAAGEARVGLDCTDDVSWPPLAAAGAVDEDDEDDENDGDDVELTEEAEFEEDASMGCMAQQADLVLVERQL